MQITERDIEILKFINAFGFCEMPHISNKFALRKPWNYKVVRRLIKAGFLIHERVFHNRPGIFRLSREGAALTGLPPLKKLSLGIYEHQITVIDVSLKLLQQYPGAHWKSERWLKYDEYSEGRFNRQCHFADGILILPDNKRVAIEVELTMKSKDRLNKILRDYWLQNEVEEVWYYCVPDIINRVKSLVNRYENITVQSLKLS